MKRISKVVCVVAMALGSTSCASRHPELGHYTVSDPAWFWSVVPGECGGPSDSKWHDFRWAASSRDFEEASQRWQTVLKRHYSGSDPFEDGLDFNMRLEAKRELMRTLYVSGGVAQGDAVLKEIQKKE